MKRMDLRTARERREWTQAELAAASGVDQATISRLESGDITNPGIATVEKLEQALALKPGILRFGAVDSAVA